MFGRYAIHDRILQLDPERDHQEIVYLISSYEGPWLGKRALEFALFRTYAVPSISALLDQTGEFGQRGQRRYDDTALIIGEIIERGYDSERGRAAIRRMNRLHGRFDISNEDYLYVLSTFIYEPMRWYERFGWRRPTEVEKQAAHRFWSEVGRRMNIKDIPESYAAFEAFNTAYERQHFQFTDSNGRVGAATVDIFCNWYPALIRPLVRRGIYAMLDEPLRRAFGFPKQPRWLSVMLNAGLKFRALLLRYLFPPRRQPWHFTETRNRTYPAGYQIEGLGPPDVPPDRESH